MRRSLRKAGWALAAAGGLGITTSAVAQSPLPMAEPGGHVLPAGETENVVLTEAQARFEEGQTELAFLADPMLFPYGLGAHVQGGVLEVRGYVPTEVARDEALRVARSQTTLAVVDKLKVHPTLAGHGAVDKPENIQRAARALLEESIPEYGKRLEVRCDARGHVTVSGSVGSYEDRLLVSRKLRQVPGCSCVINELTLGTAHEARPVQKTSATTALHEAPPPSSKPTPKLWEPVAPPPPLPAPITVHKDNESPAPSSPRSHSTPVPLPSAPEIKPLAPPAPVITTPTRGTVETPVADVKPAPKATTPIVPVIEVPPLPPTTTPAKRPTPPTTVEMPLPPVTTAPKIVTPPLPKIEVPPPAAAATAPKTVTPVQPKIEVPPLPPTTPPVKQPTRPAPTVEMPLPEATTTPKVVTPALPKIEVPPLPPATTTKPAPTVLPGIDKPPSESRRPLLPPVQTTPSVTLPPVAPTPAPSPAPAALPPVKPMPAPSPTPVTLPPIASPSATAPSRPVAPAQSKAPTSKPASGSSEESYVTEGTISFDDPAPPKPPVDKKPATVQPRPITPMVQPPPANPVGYDRPTSVPPTKTISSDKTASLPMITSQPLKPAFADKAAALPQISSQPIVQPPLPPVKPASGPVTLTPPPVKATEGTLTLPPSRPASSPVVQVSAPPKASTPVAPAKAPAPVAPTRPAATTPAGRLKERLEDACGAGYDVRVTATAKNGMQVSITAKNEADGQRLMERMTPVFKSAEFSAMEINAEVVWTK
jgi:hypothetical protein